MHAQELVHLATLLAVHSERMVQCRVPPPSAALELYWTASKCRLDRWSRAIKSLTAAPCGPSVSFEALPRGGGESRILDEILVSEILCRVWTAVCRAYDRRHGASEFAPLAASVLTGHLEARHRVLNLMVYGQGIGVELAVGLNRRRVKHEYWTDVLLAFLKPQAQISDLVFEPARVARWSAAMSRDRRWKRNDRNGSLSMAAISSAYLRTTSAATGNEDLNQRIYCALIGCMPPLLFDTTGVPVSASYLSVWQSSPDIRGRVLHRAARGNGDAGDDSWFRRGKRPDPPRSPG